MTIQRVRKDLQGCVGMNNNSNRENGDVKELLYIGRVTTSDVRGTRMKVSKTFEGRKGLVHPMARLELMRMSDGKKSVYACMNENLETVYAFKDGRDVTDEFTDIKEVVA